MTPTPHPDPFEEELRRALAKEAGGPAPERLVTRLASARRQNRPTGSPTAPVRWRIVPRPGPNPGFGFGLLAALVVLIAAGLLTHGFDQLAGGPQPSHPIASGPASAPPTVAPSPATTRSPAPSAAASPQPTPGGVPAGGPVPAGFQPVSLTFVSADRGWLLGSATCAGSPCSAIVRTTDGGRTWAGIPAPDAPIAPAAESTGGISRLRFADPLDGWAFGPDLWVTHDGGSSWQRVTLPGTGAGGQVMALETSGGLVHVAFMEADPAGGIRIATSPVATDAWTVSSDRLQVGAGPAPQAQLVLHGTAGWLVEVNRTVVDGARLTATGWQAWQPPCLDANGPALLAAASADQLVAACDVGVWSTPSGVHLFTSSDGGTSFAEAAARVPVLGLWGSAAAPASPTVVVAGNLSNGGMGLVASFDLGRTWSTVYDSKALAAISELGFTTQSQGVAIVTRGSSSGSSSQLLMTRDGGRTWAPVTLAGP